MNAFVGELKRLVNKGEGFQSRRIIFSDSKVALGAWGKGRSSSHSLNRCIRRALGPCLFGGIRCVGVWIPTDLNLSDDPSRFVPLRSPSSRPAWADPYFSSTSPKLVYSDEHQCPAYPSAMFAPAQESPPVVVGAAFCGASGAPCTRDSESQWLSTCGSGMDSQYSTTYKVDTPTPVYLTSHNAQLGSVRLAAAAPCQVVAQQKDSREPRLSRTSPSQCFIELWSGCGALTNAVKCLKRRNFTVGVPIDAYPPSGYRAEHDFLRSAVQNSILAAARRGDILWAHLGITCTTWSRLRLLSVGTRRFDLPLGDGSRPEERQGNREVSFAVKLILTLIQAKCFFTLENPATSLMWRHPRLARLIRDFSKNGKQVTQFPAFTVDFDQCMYGLGCKHGHVQEHWQKRTRIFTNIPTLAKLEHNCDRSHEHTVVLGSLKVSGKSVNRSKLAGAYPPLLCKRWAALATDWLNAYAL